LARTPTGATVSPGESMRRPRSGIEQPSSDAAQRALKACVAAALRTSGKPLSIHDYARATGISARMLIHYFGTKTQLDHAVIRGIDNGLRTQAELLAQARGGMGAVEELVQGFRTPQSAQVRKLFRTLLAKAFAGDRVAVAALVEERERWAALFEGALKSHEEAMATVTLLLGAAMDAILDDMAAEQPASKQRRTRSRR
jgi:AcrR family transcriptional regulator